LISSGVYVLLRRRLVDDKDVVAHVLCYEADRDAPEGVPDEVLNIVLRDVEGDDGDLATRLAQLVDLGMSSDSMLDAVDGVGGCGQGAVDVQVDGQDGVAVSVYAGKFIQAGMVLGGFGVVGGDSPDRVVELCIGLAEHRSRAFHAGTFS
jgi:hypothetical protein